MPYNPNSIWGSRDKNKPAYTPPGDPTSYTQIPGAQPGKRQTPPPGGPPHGSSPLGSRSSGPPSFFHRHGLAFFTVGIFLAIGLAALIYYLLLPPATPNVVITFSNPGPATVGVPFPIVVSVSNESKRMIQNAQLNVSLPNGLSFASGTTATETVGSVSSGTVNPPVTLWLVATGNAGTPGTTQTVNTTLTYQTAETGTANFESDADTSVAIGTQPALSFSYNAPTSIFSGQNFDVTVNYQNNTPESLQGITLQMEYPPAFHFVSSSTTAPTDAGDDTWNLGALGANATGTLTITGNIVGPAQAQYQMTGTIGATFSGQDYPAYTAPISFAVTPSPLSLTLTLNNTSTYIAKPSDSLNYVLTYTNNSNITFQTVNITAVLTGQMFNFATLQTNGSFNSKSDTVTWQAANTPGLAALAPGQSGSVRFTVNTLAAFPAALVSEGYKDYTLGVTAQAQSPTVPPNTAGANTTSVTTLTSKVGGQMTLAANGYAKEITSAITNTGPYPPTVDQPTEYTIHWNLANYSTDMENVTVSAYLQSGTTFTGVATSTVASSTFTYNAGTGQVTWTIPYVPATAGVVGGPVQEIFQVSNTPAVNQVGQSPTLVGQTTLTATDEWTGSTVQATGGAITTRLPNDPSVSGQLGVVVQ
ncbi:MAG TPA: hypothetical protein VMA75_02520 [Candidatus Paceibacterota bacterium]|nr:hypothetical protein [Candidatus Paceibacterota bacterium]